MNRILVEIDIERTNQIAHGYDAAHDDAHTDGSIATAAGLVAIGEVDFAADFANGDGDDNQMAVYILEKHGRDARRCLIIAAALLVAEIERLDRLNPRQDPERIHVEQIGPSELVGIAPCEDGSGGWVVMRQSGEGAAEPVGDDHGSIVYVDVLDAVEVLRTGTVWKHDMGEGESDPHDEEVSPDQSEG